VVETGLESYPVVVLGINGIESSESASRVLLLFIYLA
jgi:hypothetical protein